MSRLRLFADNCIIYRGINSNDDEVLLQKDLDQLYHWTETNKMRINESKSKLITFSRSKHVSTVCYKLGRDQISRVSSCKYLGVYFDSKLSWGNQVNYVVGKAWRSLHFVMRNLRKSNMKARELAYTSLVRPVMEYGASCWDPYQIGHGASWDRIQIKATKFVFKGINNCIRWETLKWRSKKGSSICNVQSVLGI